MHYGTTRQTQDVNLCRFITLFGYDPRAGFHMIAKMIEDDCKIAKIIYVLKIAKKFTN